MGKNMVGSEGRALIDPPVTGRGDRVLPIQRESQKLRAGRQTLAQCMAVDFQSLKDIEIDPYTPTMLYNLLKSFGYVWLGDKWLKLYPCWIRYGKGTRG